MERINYIVCSNVNLRQKGAYIFYIMIQDIMSADKPRAPDKLKKAAADVPCKILPSSLMPPKSRTFPDCGWISVSIKAMVDKLGRLS